MILDTIKTKIFDKYKKDDTRWLFFSLFDKDGKLMISNWVFETDKKVWDLIEIIYAGILDKEKGATIVVVDVVTEVIPESDMAKLLALSTKEYWVFLINNEMKKSGVVLPDTKWVWDIKTALWLIKQKYGVSGNVLIYVFKTDRIAFNV